MTGKTLPSFRNPPAAVVHAHFCARLRRLSRVYEKVLYSFQGGNDGQTPAGGVVFDNAGNLYGATYEGGSRPALRRDAARSSSSVREVAAPGLKLSSTGLTATRALDQREA
jgi:hypothetical protein